MCKECDWRTSSGKVFHFFSMQKYGKRVSQRKGCDVEVLIVDQIGYTASDNTSSYTSSDYHCFTLIALWLVDPNVLLPTLMQLNAQFPLPELTARVNGQSWRVIGFHYRVNTGRVDELTVSTRPVNSASGNRALVSKYYLRYRLFFYFKLAHFSMVLGPQDPLRCPFLT